MSQALIPPTVDNDVLVAVHEAVYMDRQLQLEYLARKRDETRHYTVHPLGLIQRGPVTYLVARFSETPKITLLAVHRIRKATRLDAAAVIPEGFNLKARSEEHTSELQSLMRISYAVFCLQKKQI